MNQSVSINLLPHKNRESAPLLSRLQLLRMLAIALLFIVSAASLMFFVLITFSPLPSLQQEQQQASQELAVYHPKMAKVLLIHERIGVIQEGLKTRSHMHPVLERISKEIPNNVSLDALKLDKNILSISLSSSTLSQIDTALKNLTTLSEKKELLGKVTLGNLSAEELTGVYVAELELQLL